MAKRVTNISLNVAPKLVKKRNGVTLSAIGMRVAGRQAIGFIEKFYIGGHKAVAGLN